MRLGALLRGAHGPAWACVECFHKQKLAWAKQCTQARRGVWALQGCSRTVARKPCPHNIAWLKRGVSGACPSH